MTVNVVTHPLTPKAIRHANAYFELEGDLNVVFRKSRLARTMLDKIALDIRAEIELAARGICDPAAVLTYISRDVNAALDAAIDIYDAAGRAETIYYAAEEVQ